MPEYASSRTNWVCCRATRLPRVIVSTDRSANSGAHVLARPGKATNISCSSPAKPAAFDATARNAATGTGDPS